MLVVAIVTLYCVRYVVRLGLVAFFTMLSSMALVVITKARRIEILVATAAYVSRL